MKTLVSLLVVFAVLFLLVLSSFFFYPFKYSFFTLVSLLATFVVVFFFPIFVVVKEGTAKIRIKMGAFAGVMLTKKGHVVSPSGDIVSGRDPRFLSFLGGIHFLGFWWLHKVYKRTLSWTKALSNGGFENREEETDFILALVDYQYALVIEDAEDEDNLPLYVVVVMTARVKNVQKAFFAVQNWFTAVALRIVPGIREYIGTRRYSKNKSECLPSKEMFDALKELINDIEERYGIEVLKLEASKIDPLEPYRDATLENYKAQRRAEGIATSVEGLILQMLHARTGIPIPELRNEFKNNPNGASEKYESILKEIYPIVSEQAALTAGAQVYRGNLGILGALLQGLSGRVGVSKEDTPEEKEKRKLRKELDSL